MITEQQTAQEFTPAYQPQNFVVSSDNTSEPNFQFICDIYIDATLVRRLKRPAHPDYPSCLFDPHRIVESFVTHDISTTVTDGFYKNSNSYAKYYLSYGEEYGLDSSGVTVYPDLETSADYYAYCSSPDSFDMVDYVNTDYLLKDTTRKFHHSFPLFYDGMRGTIFERGQSFFLHMATMTNNTIDRLVIITYDDTRTMIDEYQIQSPYLDITGDDDRRFLRCAIGYNANDIDQSKLATGTQPIFTSDVRYYEVYVVNASNTVVSETLYFEFNDNCTSFDTFELQWLDPLGGFSSFVFTHAHTENIKIDRKQYKQQVGTQSNNAFTIAKSDRGYQNYFTSSNSELKIRSGWITEDQFNFIRYVKESPQVFINDNGTLIAVNVTDSDYEVKQVLNTNLINFEVTLKYSVNNYRQRY